MSQQYVFGGKLVGPGRLVLSLVHHWVAHYPATTKAEMEKLFPGSFVGRFGVFKDLQTAQALSVSRKRYFLEENEIVLIEGEKYAVTSQITTETANKLLSHLRPLGLKILENR